MDCAWKQVAGEEYLNQNGDKNRQVRKVISWRDCEYDPGVFRSMILARPDGQVKKTMIREMLCQ
jgi:hypothetical protein